jgi:glycosyltransferase involved in cell wall biosynthesis
MTHSRKIIIAAAEIGAGGLGSYIDTLAMGLKAGDWDVYLLSTNTRGDLFDRMKKSVECYDLSEHPLSMKKILKAAELVNSISPDILLMNNCALMHYALPLIRTVTKPVAVLHSDDKRFYKTASFFKKRIFRWIAPTKGVAVRCKTYLQQEQRNRVRIIPHGVDNKLFTVNKNSRVKIRGSICFVGFIAENKGADLLPDIFNRVSKAYKNAHLTIVGRGPLEQTLKKRCEINGTLHKCIFTGAVNYEKVATVLRDSDILLLPTRIEGFGLSVVEAMMSGAVPVVSWIKGVTDDIVSDGITGLLIEPDDTEGFANAIVSLLKNPEKLISMAEAARKTAVSRYSAEIMLDAYEALFAEEDDRQERKKSNRAGWFTELLTEVLRTSTYRDLLKKGKYLIR